jgi:hypothetical protein
VSPVSPEPYEQTFSVDHVDWTSPRSFTVCVFIFDSPAKAQAHAALTTAWVGHFPPENRSKIVGAHLFVAAKDALGAPGVVVADFKRVVVIAEGH